MPIPNISQRDLEILVTAWAHCSGGMPKIDNDKLAEMLGLKNAGSAATIYCAAKKRFFAAAGVSQGEAPPKASGKKRKTATEDGDEETPSKPKRHRGKKAKGDNEEDDDESASKVKGEVKDYDGEEFV